MRQTRTKTNTPPAREPEGKSEVGKQGNRIPWKTPGITMMGSSEAESKPYFHPYEKTEKTGTMSYQFNTNS